VGSWDWMTRRELWSKWSKAMMLILVDKKLSVTSREILKVDLDKRDYI
jgi:hypothetical protein